MNCVICQEDISGEARASVPCCANMYHTRCAIQYTANRVRNSHYYDILDIPCLCGTTLYTVVNPWANTNSDPPGYTPVETLMQNAAFKAELKEIKKYSARVNKIAAQLKQSVRDSKLAFFADIHTHITALRDLRRTKINALKQTTEYKEYVKGVRGLAIQRSRFAKKYNISPYSSRTLFSISSMYCRRRFSTNGMVKWPFRIKIPY
jgi:hypothetical protein